MDISQVVKVVMEQIKETVRSETVVGTPVQRKMRLLCRCRGFRSVSVWAAAKTPIQPSVAVLPRLAVRRSSR